jgi:hypothetical protein
MGCTNLSRTLTQSGGTTGFLAFDLCAAAFLVGVARYVFISTVFGSNANPMISPVKVI